MYKPLETPNFVGSMKFLLIPLGLMVLSFASTFLSEFKQILDKNKFVQFSTRRLRRWVEFLFKHKLKS